MVFWHEWLQICVPVPAAPQPPRPPVSREVILPFFVFALTPLFLRAVSFLDGRFEIGFLFLPLLALRLDFVVKFARRLLSSASRERRVSEPGCWCGADRSRHLGVDEMANELARQGHAATEPLAAARPGRDDRHRPAVVDDHGVADCSERECGVVLVGIPLYGLSAQRSYPLPTPLAIGVGILAGQCPGQWHAPQATRQIPVVLPTHHLQMLSEALVGPWLATRSRDLFPFPVAEKQFASREVDVLHVQLQRLEQT